MTTPMGRPVADLDDFLDVQDPPALEIAPQPVAASAPPRRRYFWWLGAAIVLIAVVVGSVWYFDRPTEGPSVGVAAVGAPSIPPGVADFAELIVAAHLAGNAETVAQLVPGAASADAMTPAAFHVTKTATLDVEAVADSYWRILVAADVLEYQRDGYVSVGLQYFGVGVIDDGNRLAGTGLPARVPAPARRAAPPRALEQATDGVSPAQAALVADFMEALLTDARDLDPYITAGSSIAAIEPAPYREIASLRLAKFDETTVVATLDAVSNHGAAVTLQYVLTVLDEGSGLRIEGLLAGPPHIESGS